MSNLPQNVNGTPEFASVLITLDHLMDRKDEHIVQKAVYSTQYPEESLYALFDYYNEPQVKSLQSTSEIVSRGFGGLSVYVYMNRHGIVQLVMGTYTLRMLIDNPSVGGDSMLTTIDALIEMAQFSLDKGKEKMGEYPPISLMQFSPEQLTPEENMTAAEAEASENITVQVAD